MRCCFCTNPASDREGVPACAACWARIDEEVRTKKREPLVVVPFGDAVHLLIEQHNRAILASGRESAIASFGGLVDRLVGPPPGTASN
jgi:hypothetical protein